MNIQFKFMSLLLIAFVFVFTACDTEEKGNNSLLIFLSRKGDLSWKGDAGKQVTYTADSVSFNMAYVPGGMTFPTDTSDLGTPATVADAYWIGETEVTYELWVKVHDWATHADRGPNIYTFANAGTQGDGDGDTTLHPVTTINWRDAMVWCNALTEWYNANNGSERTSTARITLTAAMLTPLRNAGDGSYGSSVNSTAGSNDAPYVDDAAKGFRLPTGNEWELAARWRDKSTNTVSGYKFPFFTTGMSASGATADCDDAAATGLVAWYTSNSGSPLTR